MTAELSRNIRYHLLTFLDSHPEASQRDVAKALGVSLGKANYCVRALLNKGMLKVRNFKNARNKTAYAYHLTPKGIQEKIDVTHDFLKHKLAEYDLLTKEIERLTSEINRLGDGVQRRP